MGVAVSSASAARHDYLIAHGFQVTQQVAIVAIMNHRAGRNLDYQILAASPEAIGALAVLAAVCSPMTLMREVRQVGMTFGSANHDATPVAAVTAVGPAPRRIFFPAKTEAAVASIPSSHKDGDAVDEHVLRLTLGHSGTWSGARNHVNPPPLLVEANLAGDQRIDRPVATDAHILAWMPASSALAAEDAAGLGNLAPEKLDTQHLRIRVAAIAARALSLFVSHRSIVLKQAFGQ